MPLESGDYIDSLNASNPLGTGDKKSQGDDHLRLIKSTIKNTFPNISGAVTPTHTELNYVAGVTSAIQTQINGKAASSHNHSAADLTSGTIPDARFPATLPALNGSALTALNGSNIATGTVADARLSSNVPLKNAANTFTATQTLSAASGAAWVATDTTNSKTTFFGADDDGAQWGVTGNNPATLFTNGIARFTTSGGGNFDFKGGTVTTNGASASEVGTHGLPINEQNGDYTLVLADRDKIILKTSGGSGETITIPANSSVAFPVGTTVTFENHGGGSLSIAITSDTMVMSGTGSTGTRTLADRGRAVAIKLTSNTWSIGGTGLS